MFLKPYSRKTIPIKNFELPQKIRPQKKYIHPSIRKAHQSFSQKKSMEILNHHMKLFQKLSFDLSSDFKVTSSKKIKSIKQSPRKIQTNIINIQKKYKTGYSEKKIRNESHRSTFQQFPKRETKLKNQNPYQHYAFKFQEKQKTKPIKEQQTMEKQKSISKFSRQKTIEV